MLILHRGIYINALQGFGFSRCSDITEFVYCVHRYTIATPLEAYKPQLANNL
jgi:hypothetical protein